VLSEHDDANALVNLVNPTSCIKATRAGHRNVQDDNVWPKQTSLIDDRAAIEFPAEKSKVVPQQRSHSLGYQVVIVCK
jgi:hypothetical protein